jgi:hypothetical protein
VGPGIGSGTSGCAGRIGEGTGVGSGTIVGSGSGDGTGCGSGIIGRPISATDSEADDSMGQPYPGTGALAVVLAVAGGARRAGHAVLWTVRRCTCRRSVDLVAP